MKKLIFVFILILGFNFNGIAETSNKFNLAIDLHTGFYPTDLDKKIFENLKKVGPNESRKISKKIIIFTRKNIGQYVPLGFYKNNNYKLLLVANKSKEFFVVYFNNKNEKLDFIKISKKTAKKIKSS